MDTAPSPIASSPNAPAQVVSAEVASAQVVGAAIVDDLSRPTALLAARRTAPPDLAGGWEVPGGKVEPGESEQDALRREIREELGVRIALGERLVAPSSDGCFDLGPGLRMAVWWAVIDEGHPTLLADHDALAWLDAETLYDVGWLPADVPVADAVAARLTPCSPEDGHTQAR